MTKDKKALIALAPVGWAYTGRDGQYYYYQIGSYGQGFKEMRCIEEDLTEANLALMARLNVTR